MYQWHPLAVCRQYVFHIVVLRRGEASSERSMVLITQCVVAEYTNRSVFFTPQYAGRSFNVFSAGFENVRTHDVLQKRSDFADNIVCGD